MLIRTVCFLALIVSTGTFAFADDEGPRTTAAPSYMPDNSPLTRGLVWVNVGFGVIDSYFDDNAQTQELGSGEIPTVGSIETNAKITTTIVHVGGSYTVGRVSGWGLNLGADLGLAGQQLTADAVPGLVEATDRKTGLSLQNLAFVGEATSSNVTLRTGYFADLARSGSEEGLETTDREHAVLLGVEGESTFRFLHLFGGLDYFMTLPASQTEVRRSQSGIQRIEVEDRGNLLNTRIGAGVSYKSVEVGLMALYRINTKSGFDAEDVRQLAEFGTPNEFDRGNVFSLSPYVTVAPARLPLQIYFKGALQREYHDYGFAVSGSNDIAPRLGGSLGLIYDF